MEQIISDFKTFFLLHRTDLLNFESIYFFVFLASCVFLYYFFGRSKIILLSFSLAFYISYSAKMTIFIGVLALINYALALAIFKNKSKILLLACLCINIGVLIYFKYANFFIENINTIGLFQNFNTLSYLVIPLGISFFTFELIHYIVDIYKGKPPILNLITFLNFIFFFPTLFAGPIKRFESFVPQISIKKNKVEIYNSLVLISRGLARKILIADQLAKFSFYGFEGTSNPTATLLGIYAFSLQIYFDFSGYTDIARGSAGLLGVKIPENFLSPYLSTNVSDFWRRWHITLMQWFRDYIYIPFGGSRKGKLRSAWNTFVVFLISGLWHGAAWHFVAWGLYHGILLTGYNFFFRDKQVPHNLFKKFLLIILTFHLVTFGWILFRAQSLLHVGEILNRLVNFSSYSPLDFETLNRLILIFLLLLLYAILPFMLKLLTRIGISFVISKTVIVAFILLLVYLSVNTYSVPFIYFQF